MRRSLGVLAVGTLLLAAPMPAQNEDKAVELYVMAGAYYFGSDPHILKNDEWNPQATVGALIPFKSKWAVMIDGTLSQLRRNEGLHSPDTGHASSLFYKANPGIPNEDRATQNLIGVFPSIVRLWRRNRFTVYFGGGFGFEHQRQKILHRRISSPDAFDTETDEFRSLVDSGAVLVANEYIRYEAFSTSRDVLTSEAMFVHGGVIANISKRIVLRAGYSWIVTYFDSFPSKSVTAGIGFRF